MTNEEMAAAVQAGDREQLVPLWLSVRRLVLKQARHRVGIGGLELEDLAQAGFLALLGAVDSFDRSAGCKFSTWFIPALKREFSVAASLRTEKQRRDPLQSAVSLDAPLAAEEDGGTLGDLLPDPSAEAAMLEVEEQDRLDRLRAAVEAAVATLPPDQQAAIQGKYWRGECVDIQTHAKALRMLRHPSRSRALLEYW